MIEKQNTLEWLDFILTIALESGESEVNTLSEAQYEHIINQIHEKKQNYTRYLNRLLINLPGKRKTQQLIQQHHRRLLMLLDQAASTAGRIHPFNTLMAGALQLTSRCIFELLGFIQTNFSIYLDLDEPAPEAFLSEFTRQHQSRISAAKQHLASQGADPNLIAILLDALSPITGKEPAQPLSLRAIFYQNELLGGLEQLLGSGQHPKIDDALLELLVYLNFNSRPFLNYYTRQVDRRIKAVEPVKEKIHQLLLHYKQFNQMHRKPGVKLSPVESDVKKVISNWFTQEIEYLKVHAQVSSSRVEPVTEVKTDRPPQPFKVMVLLSVDQIGLLLRALDSLRILKARSLNAVFESIVPFLSTPRKTEISPDSMRSKSYAFEEKDKQVVIKVLESLITWIKEY